MSVARQDVIRLRRTARAVISYNFSVAYLALGAGLMAVAFIGAEPVVGVLALGVAAPGLIAFFMGVRVRAGELTYGYWWRRHAVPIPDIARVRIGVVEGFGYRSADVRAMTIVTTADDELVPFESSYCSRERLLEWAGTLQACQTGSRIEVEVD